MVILTHFLELDKISQRQLKIFCKSFYLTAVHQI